VLGFGTAGYLLAILAPAVLIRTEDYTITADFVHVGGMPRGTKVQSAGVEIGRVGDVALVDDRARLQIEVTIAVRLPIDSREIVKTQLRLPTGPRKNGSRQADGSTEPSRHATCNESSARRASVQSRYAEIQQQWADLLRADLC
jgi:ABC-type transporter Mla subunit MlaD